MSINIAVGRSKSNALNRSYEATSRSAYTAVPKPAKEREIVEPETRLNNSPDYRDER